MIKFVTVKSGGVDVRRAVGTIGPGARAGLEEEEGGGGRGRRE